MAEGTVHEGKIRRVKRILYPLVKIIAYAGSSAEGYPTEIKIFFFLFLIDKSEVDGGNSMKKFIAIVLCLVLVLSLVGCGNNNQSSDTHDTNYEEGYTAGYEDGYNDGKQQMTENKKCFAQFSGAFTATVEQLLTDYYVAPGKTIAVVHFFQDRPFLLWFQEDLTGELVEGTPYVFEFKTFEVELPADEENPDISDYMYSIEVTNYRVAEENEIGLASKLPTVEIVSK